NFFISKAYGQSWFRHGTFQYKIENLNSHDGLLQSNSLLPSEIDAFLCDVCDLLSSFGRPRHLLQLSIVDAGDNDTSDQQQTIDDNQKDFTHFYVPLKIRCICLLIIAGGIKLLSHFILF